MIELAIAIIGGAVGSVAAALLAAFGRLRAVPGQVARHGRLAAERNADLEAWVDDDTRRLEREEESIVEEHKRLGLSESGQLDRALADSRTDALHCYRDQERQRRRDIDELLGAESWMHRRHRRNRGLEAPSLSAAERVQPVLDYWRQSIRRGNRLTVDVRDPTRRTIRDTLAELPGRTTWNPGASK